MDYRVIIIVLIIIAIIVGIWLISYLVVRAKRTIERSLEKERLIEQGKREQLAQELKRQKENKLEIRRRTEASKNHIVICMDKCLRCRRDRCLEEIYNEKRI